MSKGVVLVLDHVPQTLAVVRSLGRAGFRVVLGRDTRQRHCPATWSRHCHEAWPHPPLGDPVAFDAALAALLDRRPDIRALFPVSEMSVLALLQARRCVGRRGLRVAMVQEPLFVACRDKAAGNDLAAQAGLRVPESRVVDDLASLHRAVADIAFPLVVKSRASRHVYGRKAYLVHNRLELDSTFAEWPAGHTDLLVQRYIGGPLASCDYVAAEGQLIGYCEARVLRTDMPDGTGFAVDFESIPPSADLQDAVQRFVATHGYSGPGLMQFIRCRESGVLYFLENNPRLAAGIAHTIDSGQDLPRLAMEAAMGRPRTSVADAAPGSYRYGYRAHWLMRDLQGLLSRRRESGRAQRRAWRRDLIRSFVRADGHITWQWRDPMPTVIIYGQFAGHQFGRFARAGRGR